MLCDEILSALDVSVQANILELLKQLRRETGIAMIFISHDLAVVEQIADTVIVLKDGEVADTGTAARIFEPPHHPYTLTLLSSIPGQSAGLPIAHRSGPDRQCDRLG
jgi:ABC-type dipeptide/oligopeptide/nickel transport system ATPase component